jgi:hypothetical protein
MGHAPRVLDAETIWLRCALPPLSGITIQIVNDCEKRTRNHKGEKVDEVVQAFETRRIALGNLQLTLDVGP